MMAEFLALVHIADVNFDDRSAHGLDSVVDGYAGMSVGTSIENDAIDAREFWMCIPNIGLLAKSGAVDGIYDVTFMITLKIGDLNVWVSLAQVFEVILKRLCSIDSRFPTPQKIEVWAIDD